MMGLFKKLILTVCSLALITAVSGCFNDQNPDAPTELNILTWDGYIPQDIMDEFSVKENVKKIVE